MGVVAGNRAGVAERVSRPEIGVGAVAVAAVVQREVRCGERLAHRARRLDDHRDGDCARDREALLAPVPQEVPRAGGGDELAVPALCSATVATQGFLEHAVDPGEHLLGRRLIVGDHAQDGHAGASAPGGRSVTAVVASALPHSSKLVDGHVVGQVGPTLLVDVVVLPAP